MISQGALLCGCGSSDLFRRGMCRRCHRRARHSREKFGGLGELVFARDGYQCQVCGSLDRAQLVRHHRAPGRNSLRKIITLCRGCHVLVHRVARPGFGFMRRGLLYALWREAHAGPEQGCLALEAAAPADQPALT